MVGPLLIYKLIFIFLEADVKWWATIPMYSKLMFLNRRPPFILLEAEHFKWWATLPMYYKLMFLSGGPPLYCWKLRTLSGGPPFQYTISCSLSGWAEYKPNQLLRALAGEDLPNSIYRLPAPTNCLFVTPLYTLLDCEYKMPLTSNMKSKTIIVRFLSVGAWWSCSCFNHWICVGPRLLTAHWRVVCPPRDTV